MRYNKIRKMDISNGPGVRVSVFMQGCSFHCKECFNPETWNFTDGKEFNDETIEKILTFCEKEYIKGLSILGGDPLHPKNIAGTTELAKAFKDKFKDKSLWLWTGYLYESLKNKDILGYVDVLIDGQFEIDKFDPRLKWCGSSNQRVINVKKSLKSNKIVLYIDEYEKETI